MYLECDQYHIHIRGCDTVDTIFRGRREDWCRILWEVLCSEEMVREGNKHAFGRLLGLFVMVETV